MGAPPLFPLPLAPFLEKVVELAGGGYAIYMAYPVQFFNKKYRFFSFDANVETGREFYEPRVKMETRYIDIYVIIVSHTVYPDADG